jgi:DNA-binding NarL/FixJ family response regulator
MPPPRKRPPPTTPLITSPPIRANLPPDPRIVSAPPTDSTRNRTIRLLVIDDHAVVRMGLVAVLSGEADLDVVAQGGGGETALALFREHRPDVVLLDLRMPRVSGIEALRQIRAEFPEAQVLLLTTSDMEEDFVEALEAGAAGYLVKTSEPTEVIAAIRVVADGGSYLPEGIRARLAARPARRAFTPREMEVLDLLRRGMSNRDIGVALGLSENTAKFHVKTLLVKLEAADRTEAVARGFERGLLRIEG